MVGTPGRVRRLAGFTLLETLLSLAIALVVITLVYSVYHTVAQTLEGQQARQSGPEHTAQVLQQISDDLSRMFLPEEEEACQIRISGNDEVPSATTIAFCALRRNEQERDLRWASVMHVEYAAVPGPAGVELIVAELPLEGPSAIEQPVTNTLLESITAFSVQAWQKDAWVDVWPGEEEGRTDGPPRAIRLRLSTADAPDTDMQTEVFIPIGQSLSGDLQRGVGP